MTVKLTVKRSYGEVTIEEENFENLVNTLRSFPEWLTVLDGLLSKPEVPIPAKEALKGVVDFTREGTVITVPRDRLSDKEAICLLLYANEPNPLQPREIARLMANSGRLSPGYGARISELRSEALILKDAGSYKLTATGRVFVENLLRKLSGGVGSP
ncbi:MAG: hypothetical protein QXJ75_00225 [Candidatus Bathyarchaeia archaeon]